MVAVEGYFSAAALEGTTIHDGCVLRSAGEGQGLGLEATKWFSKGEEVWRERPVLFQQHFYSAATAPSCLNCGRLLGNLGEVLGWALGARGKSLNGYPDAAECALLRSEKLQLPRPVSCPHCRETRFCSDECRDVQLTGGHHRILCAELPPERRRAWLRFREHARRQHETFILAAFAIAQIMCDVLYGGDRLPEAIKRICCYHSGPWQELPPPDVDDRPERTAARLRRLEASLGLLRAALGAPADFAELLELDFYSRLVGMLDLTTVDISRKHCFEDGLQKALAGASADVNTDLRHIAAEWWLFQERAQDDVSGSSSDDDGPDLSREQCLLPPFEGAALSPSVALTNHSCFPNVDVACQGSSELVATARRDIAPGQQLLMTYGASGALGARQAQLWKEYGFHCLCVRCRGEACMEVLEGRCEPETAAPRAWLEGYAAAHEMSAREAASSVLQGMPPGLFEEPAAPPTMLAASVAASPALEAEGG